MAVPALTKQWPWALKRHKITTIIGCIAWPAGCLSKMESLTNRLGVAAMCLAISACVSATQVGNPIPEQVGFGVSVSSLVRDSADSFLITISYKNREKFNICIYPAMGHLPIVVAAANEKLRLSEESEIGVKE